MARLQELKPLIEEANDEYERRRHEISTRRKKLEQERKRHEDEQQVENSGPVTFDLRGLGMNDRPDFFGTREEEVIPVAETETRQYPSLAHITTNTASTISTVAAPNTSTASIEHKATAYTEGGAPLRTIFVPEELRSSFLDLALPNTRKKLETCGILCGVLNRNAFFVTHLLVPQQESTSDTCSTTDEEGMFAFLDENELFTLGWIHTHPTQTCFLSSVDVHTQNSYQLMLAEAIAIVCAPMHEPR